MTLWTPCSAHPLLSTESKALCAPCCWWRGHGYEARPGGPAKPCPGSAVLHSLLFPPGPLLSFEWLQHQSSSPLSTIPHHVEVAKEEALLPPKATTGSGAEWFHSLGRERLPTIWNLRIPSRNGCLWNRKKKTESKTQKHQNSPTLQSSKPWFKEAHGRHHVKGTSSNPRLWTS